MPEQKWAVLIGINGYHESLGRLEYSVNDCRRLAEVLATGEDAFPGDHVLVLADDEAAERRPTYANIHSWLASWLAQPDENDTVLVFFAGHGREMDGKCYLVPGDATLQTIHVTGIPVPYVQDLLSRCKARQKVLILDACHSGAGRDVSTMAAPMMETLSAGKGIYTLTSCDVNELSHEWDEKKQGVFSYYVAEALAGGCLPDAQGRLTADALYNWIFKKVQSWTATRRCGQTPKRFCETTGDITLRRAETDWRKIALDLRERLEQAEKERVPAPSRKDEKPPERKRKARTSFKLVISPPQAEVACFLDEVPLPRGFWGEYETTPGIHRLRVVPRNCLWGPGRGTYSQVEGMSSTVRVRLARVLHSRAVSSFLIIVFFGVMVGLASAALPSTPIATFNKAVKGLGLRLGLFMPLLIAPLFTLPIYAVVRLIRGLKLDWPFWPSFVFDIEFADRRMAPGLIFLFASVLSSYVLWYLAFFLYRADIVVFSGVLGMTTFLGVALCLVPWPSGMYDERAELS